MNRLEALRADVEAAYQMLDGSEASEAYSDRHGIESAAILTILDGERAELLTEYLRPRIEGRTVVEIGAGIGMLALFMGEYAKRVYAIEAEPAWSWAFVCHLYKAKPKNVSFLFGAADEFSPLIRGDVALFCTHSGRPAMARAAAMFAPAVIDVHAEILGEKRIAQVERAARRKARATLTR